MRRRLWDFLGKWLSRRGNANTMFALADKCHGWQRKGGPVMTRNTWPLSFRKSTVVASIRVRGGQSFLRGFYGNPTLRAMHSIHKCVAKDAPHLFHWRLSPYIVKNKNSDLWASSQIAVSFWLCMARNSQFKKLLLSSFLFPVHSPTPDLHGF